MTDFREILYLGHLWKPVEELQISFKSGTLHFTFYCYRRNKIALEAPHSIPVRWYQAARIDKEIKTLDERARMVRYVYFTCPVSIFAPAQFVHTLI